MHKHSTYNAETMQKNHPNIHIHKYMKNVHCIWVSQPSFVAEAVRKASSVTKDIVVSIRNLYNLDAS